MRGVEAQAEGGGGDRVEEPVPQLGGVGQVALAAAARRGLEGDADAALFGVAGEGGVDLAELAQVLRQLVRWVVRADRRQPPEVHPEGGAGVGDDRVHAEDRGGVEREAEGGDALPPQGEVGRQQVEHRGEGGDGDAVGREGLRGFPGPLRDDRAQIEMPRIGGAGDRLEGRPDVDLDRLQAVPPGLAGEVGEGPGLDPDERREADPHRSHLRVGRAAWALPPIPQRRGGEGARHPPPCCSRSTSLSPTVSGLAGPLSTGDRDRGAGWLPARGCLKVSGCPIIRPVDTDRGR